MLNLALSPNSGRPFGWGICTLNLEQELKKKADIVVLPYEEHGKRIEGKVLHSIADIRFRTTSKYVGDRNYGYCFFEMDFVEESFPNAMSFDHIFCGSTFNQKVLAYYDLFHTSLLIQGIDHEIFDAKPPRKDDGKFYIFSGGKFEYRKGQDLVLKAFKTLMDTYKDMHLVTVWETLWPQTIGTMQHSTHVDFAMPQPVNGWNEFIGYFCDKNDIPSDRVTHYPLIPQSKISSVMEGTDVGIFPNRCEGGTNLMLMEYMAKGRPVIASYNTGHKDILNKDNAILLHNQKVRPIKPFIGQNWNAHWCEPDINELVSNLEWAYLHRDELKRYGERAAESMKQYTWEKAADSIIDQMLDPEVDKPDYLPHRYSLGSMLTNLGYTGEGAEIGVWAGTLSRFIYSRWIGKKLHLIDRWKEDDDYKDILNKPQEVQDQLYEKVKETLGDKKDVNIIRKESLEAVKQFRDGQLDWVYIDADHARAKEDLEAWCPKVRVGGLVAGDDYIDEVGANGVFKVKSAVDEFVAKHGYKLKLSADAENKYRSWYFIKDH